MEEQHVQLTEEQYIAKLMAEAAQAAAAPQGPQQEAIAPAITPVPPVRVKRGRKRSPYRYWALLLAGVLCYALLIVAAALVWGSLLYARLGDVGEAVALPLAIFLGAVFLSCCLVTMLSRGGTIFPALGVAIIANIIPFLLADMPEMQAKAVAVKLGYTLLVAIAGFALSKALYIRGKNKKRQALP